MVTRKPRVEEEEAAKQQETATSPTLIKMLSPNELYALIVVEQKAIEFQETRLSQATKNLEQVDQQLAFWNNKRNEALVGVHEIRGAIAGCGVLITEELEKLGVSKETFEEQKAQYFKELETPTKE
jgi:hypothetical protein